MSAPPRRIGLSNHERRRHVRTLGQFEDFPATFQGPTFRPGDVGYSEVRAIWNMRRDDEDPALIVRPLHVDDVVIAIKYAAEKATSVAIHSGGHGIDAGAMPADALVIDTSLLKAINVDEATNQVTIQAGVRLGELDAAAQAYGLVVPAGVVTDTGAAGLTLGGGIGHNIRRFGATVDNLLSVQMVTADGRVVTASEQENTELFWGVRGAGHNLGVITSLTYQGHKVGPRVMSGERCFFAADAAAIFGGIDAAMAAAPRELAVTLMVLPGLPQPGQPEVFEPAIVNMLVVYTGELASYDEAMTGVRALATPFVDGVRETSWLEANSIVDKFTPPGRRYHMTGGYLPGLNAEIGRIAVEAVSSCVRPNPLVPTCSLTFPVLGGALLDVAENSTAFSRTGAQWLLEAMIQWDSREDDPMYMPWVDQTIAALQPFMATNAYTNLSSDRGAEWLRGAYGPAEKWERIVALKQEWDPQNRFSYNKNISRAAEPSLAAL
jgi:FAD/FMN-containing dehydrogenase